MKIAGIDPSINCSGKCIMELDDKTFEIRDVQLYAYNSTKKRCIDEYNCHVRHTSTKYTKMNMFDRQNIAYEIMMEGMEDVKHVAFENYAFGFAGKSKDGKTTKESRSLVQMGEFIGGLKKLFYDQGKGIIVYPPRTVKLFATGNGGAGKPMMCETFKEEFPQFYPTEAFSKLPEFKDPHGDMCDAFWMAETLRNQLIYEILGTDSMDEGTVAILETSASKDTKPIVETELMKKQILTS